MALSKSFSTGQILTADDLNTHAVNHVPTPGDPYDTGWLPLSVTIPTYSPVEYRRVGLTVYLQGTPNGEDLPSGFTTIGTLPNGFRPSQTKNIPLATNASGTVHLLRITSAGALEIDPHSSPRRSYLDSVSFLLE